MAPTNTNAAYAPFSIRVYSCSFVVSYFRDINTTALRWLAPPAGSALSLPLRRSDLMHVHFSLPVEDCEPGGGVGAAKRLGKTGGPVELGAAMESATIQIEH